jgi:hypothetical protein
MGLVYPVSVPARPVAWYYDLTALLSEHLDNDVAPNPKTWGRKTAKWPREVEVSVVFVKAQ